MSFVRIFLLLSMFAVLGCGPGAPAPVDADTQSDALVQALKEALESGQGFGEARGILSSLESVDAAKAASISAELDALDALTDPGEKAAKAKEIASKL